MKKRQKNPFDKVGVGELYCWLTEEIIIKLTEFKEKTISTPSYLFLIEYTENKKDYPHLDKADIYYTKDKNKINERELLEKRAINRWDTILEEMIQNFKSLQELEDDPDWKNIEEYDNKLQAQLDKSFDLLKEWFFHLWI